MLATKKLQLCLLGSIGVLLVVFILIWIFRDNNSKYFRFGPQDDLIVISIHINNWDKYFGFILVVGIIKIVEVVVNEIGLPILGFNVYNPDKKIITEFTKNELQFYANAIYLVTSIRQVLLIVISVTQIDIALIVCVISELASLYTIRILLNEKEFIKENKKTEEKPLLSIINS